ALANTIRWAHRAIGKPIYVTENGVADAADRLRPWQLALAVRALHAAITAGADVRGYYHWTLVDNFEWSEGWKTRFGLVALDPQTQTRTPRHSAALYGVIARANALTPAMLEEYAPAALDG
ncbi:MAG TPA: family 1 glycosylhydrolase, partial [Ktedonobacterales bacterium]|nr:family 1 glycosylhydrolase [Ktedonobacterales bacterium]